MKRSQTDATVMIDARYLNGKESGIGRYTRQLIRWLLEIDEGLQLRLVTHRGCPEPVKDRRVRCEVYGGPANSFRTRCGLSRAVDFRGVDLFHSPFNLLPADLPVPGVFTLHDIMWLMDPGLCTGVRWRRWVTGSFYGAMIPRSVREAARVLTVSESSARDIEGWFPDVEGRVRVAKNGVDREFSPMRPEEAWPRLSRWMGPRTPFVLVVGQGAPYKNHEGAVRGFLEAFGDVPEVRLVLVRRLYSKMRGELGELLRDPRLAGRVVGLPYVGLEELRALYSMALALVFVSKYEGFGLPALEAMASGTCVVASDRGAPAEICGEGAVLVDPEDPVEVGEGLRRIWENEKWREEQVRRGMERSKRYGWEECAREVLSVYREVLEERKY